jgi:hypothetical protein
MTKITIISGFTAIPEGRFDLKDVRLSETTVHDVKVQISQQTPNKIPVETQMLFWRGYKLDHDDQTLLEACVGVCPDESLQTKGANASQLRNKNPHNNSKNKCKEAEEDTTKTDTQHETVENDSLVLFLTVPLKRRSSDNSADESSSSSSSFPPILARSLSDLITTVRQELSPAATSTTTTANMNANNTLLFNKTKGDGQAVDEETEVDSPWARPNQGCSIV